MDCKIFGFTIMVVRSLCMNRLNLCWSRWCVYSQLFTHLKAVIQHQKLEPSYRLSMLPIKASTLSWQSLGMVFWTTAWSYLPKDSSLTACLEQPRDQLTLSMNFGMTNIMLDKRYPLIRLRASQKLWSNRSIGRIFNATCGLEQQLTIHHHQTHRNMATT